MNPVRQARLVLHRTKAASIQQFHRRHRLRAQRRRCPAAALRIPEHQQGRGFVRIFGNGVVGYRADETQRAFGAHHQVRQDVEWAGKIHQGVQGQAGGVFQAVFMTNTLRQLRILPGIDSQLFQGRQQITVAVAKRRNACRILGIQHWPHTGQRVVAVLGGATAHTAGIVRNNAANLAGVDGRRIRSDLEALGC